MFVFPFIYLFDIVVIFIQVGILIRIRAVRKLCFTNIASILHHYNREKITLELKESHVQTSTTLTQNFIEGSFC